MTDLSSLLTWITGSGGAVILIAWAVAWYMEGVPWWGKLTPQTRSLAILGMALFLGLISVWTSGQPALIAVLDPYFKAIIAIVGVWLSTQVAHKVDPNA